MSPREPSPASCPSSRNTGVHHHSQLFYMSYEVQTLVLMFAKQELQPLNPPPSVVINAFWLFVDFFFLLLLFLFLVEVVKRSYNSYTRL